jgi:ABC-type transport system involved in multi-copper enzyme maturation permease subunit
MTFLPIVTRELRLASRRRTTYWLRSAAALSMIVIGAWLFLILRGESPKQLAMALFCVLTGGAVVFALISGPRSTADCISEEKREGTLGLLFLTDLRGYDIVLGKLVAGSLNAFYAIVAVLPMMAIPLLLGGGLTLAEFFRMSLVVLDALLFSLTVAICVSALSRSAYKSAALSVCLVLLFVAGLPALGAVIAGATKARTVNPLFLTPSIGFSYYLAFDAAYKTSQTWFWTSLAAVHGVSWFCLVLASLSAPRSWQDRAARPNARSWRERWQTWNSGDAADRNAFRTRLLDANPILWLSARIRSKPILVWLFLAISAAVWIAAWWRFKKDWLNEGVYIATALLVNLALRYWLAGEATRALADHRKSGALELLLSTPLSVGQILRGQGLALRRQFLGPVVAVLLTETIFMLSSVQDAVPEEERIFWFAMWGAGMFMLVADLVALYWVGMWQGLIAKNPLRAAGGSLFRILVLPWIGYGFALLIVILRDIQGASYQTGPTWKFFLGLWFVLGMAVDLGFGIWARQKLLTEFRLAAQERYGSHRDFWKMWFGTLKPHVRGSTAGPKEVAT